MAILTRQSAKIGDQAREILFVDGFAGPGEYNRGEPGSPLIALNAALNHTVSFPNPIRMLFIERREDRYEHLKQMLAPFKGQIATSKNVRAVEPKCGDCDAILNTLLSDCEAKHIKFGPALAFLDQFGYGEVSMALIARILAFPVCEVFTYLDYKDMNRWITDDTKADAFTRAFGGEEWRDCVGLPEKQRREKLLALYKTALKYRGGAKFVVSFLMYDRNNIPLYWLLFCTKSLRGIEEMKKAMWKVDETGEFRFSDRDDPSQLMLLEKRFDQTWLAEELTARLAGQTMDGSQIKEFVLTETPCYLFKAALKSLESSKRVTIAESVDRKPNTFPDKKLAVIKIQFPKSLFN